MTAHPAGATAAFDSELADRDAVLAELAVLRSLVRGAPGGEVARAENRFAAAAARLGTRSSLDEIAVGFGLSGFERSVLLLAAAPELVAAVSDELEAATGARRLTFGAALALVPEAHWSALTPAAPLRHWELLHLLDPLSPTGSPLAVHERVLHHIAGVRQADREISALAPGCPAPVALPPTLVRAAHRVAAAWVRGSVPLVHGPQVANLRAVVAAAAAGSDRTLRVVAYDDLPRDAAARDRLLRRLEREAVLENTAWAVDLHDQRPEGGVGALPSVVGFRGPMAMLASAPPTGSVAGSVAIRVERLDVGERRAALAAALAEAGATAPGADVDAAAAAFDLSIDDLEACATEVRRGASLWSASRASSRCTVGDLARVVRPRATWNDLVLPPPQTHQLRALVASVRHRGRVLHGWGFDARTARGLGTTALFAGPSGTGKTLAAEVVARELDFDLIQIDLSQVVSKYIGETEKQLRRVFDAAEDGGTVLLFDEADTLFGRRTEIRDSHDRYANLEVGYLLQRMESFRGLAILTTNARGALDPAFTRRLRAVVTFPYPDPTLRERLWKRAFPAATPVAGLDAQRLAALDLPGGGIASVALTAAFLAAADGGIVREEHVRTAARWEFAKSGRSTTSGGPRGR